MSVTSDEAGEEVDVAVLIESSEVSVRKSASPIANLQHYRGCGVASIEDMGLLLLLRFTQLSPLPTLRAGAASGVSPTQRTSSGTLRGGSSRRGIQL